MCNLAITILCAIHLNIGIALHDTKMDWPEINGLPNPLGEVRLTVDTPDPRFSFFYEHVSSIPREEAGLGLNMVGMTLRIF